MWAAGTRDDADVYAVADVLEDVAEEEPAGPLLPAEAVHVAGSLFLIRAKLALISLSSSRNFFTLPIALSRFDSFISLLEVDS